MIIYVTPFNTGNLLEPGASTDSGFGSMSDVVAAMGEPVRKAAHMLIYGDGDDKVIFSKCILRIDESGNND